MKKLFIIFILFTMLGCGIEPVRPVQKWDLETDFYFTDEMYNHPEIMENIRTGLNDLQRIINIDFYELSEPKSDCIIFDYGNGENFSTIGKPESGFGIVKITSEKMNITYQLIFVSLGLELEIDENYEITEDDCNDLKFIYGSRMYIR